MNFAGRCGVHDEARAAACEAVLERVAREHVEQVRVAWADLHGTQRGKSLVCGADTEGLAQALQGGIGMVSTLLLKDTADRTAFKVFEPGAALPAGFGAANNLVLLPDPASYVALPWAPATGWMRAEPFFDDGTPVPADPRRVLQRALAALAGRGLGLCCGLEVEFHIYRITDERLAADGPDAGAWPAEAPALALLHPGYQLLSEAWADRCDEALAIVRRTALGLGLPLRSLEIELGPSQFEAVFAPTGALAAADQLLLFRNAVRQALHRAGYHASFACRPPLPGAVASGWHLHHSLVDAAGHNVMPSRQGAGDRRGARQLLSDDGAHWLAGLLAHATGMAALCAPTLGAYARYRGSVMAPQAASWGRDNRGAMLRVVGGPGDRATRIENRLCEPMANPYLAIAAQVWAGLDGMEHALDPGPATDSPYADTAPLLPASLAEALDALAADAVLQQGLGEPMAQVFHAIKRQEIARQAAATDAAAWERREYLARF